MKCQSLFYWKNKKKYHRLSSADFAEGVVKVNIPLHIISLVVVKDTNQQTGVTFANNTIKSCVKSGDSA